MSGAASRGVRLGCDAGCVKGQFAVRPAKDLCGAWTEARGGCVVERVRENYAHKIELCVLQFSRKEGV